MVLHWIAAAIFAGALVATNISEKESPAQAEEDQKEEIARDKFDKAKSGGKEYSQCQSAAIKDAFNTASNEEKRCMLKDIDEQREELLKLCEELDAGRNIGGGCYHLIGYLHDNQIEKALKSCGVSWSYSASCNENGGAK